MKIQKVITIITIVLLIAIITIASVFGIYKLKEYKVVQVVPEYLLGMRFTDSRIINLEADKSVEGASEALTLDNYKLSKKILKNRLKELGVDEYRVTLDESNGNIQVRVQENEDTDAIIYKMLQSGTFEVKDSETEEVLIDTSKVEKANVVYGQTETGTSVYLQIKLNKEGKQKLEEISKIYIETVTQITNEEGKTEDKTETKNVSVELNGEEYVTTYFGQPIVDGMLNIPMGTGANAQSIEQYVTSANELAVILNSGILPITYIETDYIEASSITAEQIKIAMYVVIGIVALMVVVFVVLLKAKGLLTSVLQIGYIALLLLVLRYTNVKITLEGIFGILISAMLNYIYLYKAFKNIELSFIKDVTLKFTLRLIPLYVIAVVFSFNSIASVYSLGMTLFWGAMVMYLYNLSLTQITLKTIK